MEEQRGGRVKGEVGGRYLGLGLEKVILNPRVTKKYLKIVLQILINL